MTKFLNILKVSIKNISGNKLRTVLTMLGLIIGIASVIILVGIGSGTSSQVTSQVQSLGADILTLNINSSDTSLDYDNIDEIEEIQGINKVAPYKTVSASITRNENSSGRANIIATTDSYIDVMNLTISDGRLLSKIDLDNNSKVCLLGSDIAETLFENDTIVGYSVKIDGDNYTVIGILTATGSSMGNDIDSLVIVPFTTAKYLGADTTINNLYIKVDDENQIESVSTSIENYIEFAFGLITDDFSVSSQDSMLNTMEEVNNSLSIMLGGIASISLIVARIGVMNVMLVSVTERTKEIGIRKALGAKKMDILVQFLIEALLLCIVGGIIGILLGIAIGNLLGQMGYSFIVEVWIVVVAFLSSAVIGLIFGIFPAYKAAKLNPIDALHTE